MAPPPFDPRAGYGQPPGYGVPPYIQPPQGYIPVPVDRFGRPLAAWWQRLLAFIIDGLILGIPKGIVIATVVTTASNGNFFTTGWVASEIIVGIVFAAIGLAYFAMLNGSDRGQTVGQMALGIAVRDEVTGGPIGPQRAALRILVFYPGIVAGWIPILGGIASLYTLVAGLSPLWDSRRQGFHDKVVHTDVIKVR
jgi:uncharacterized RDD family membrane protein YckC